MEKENIANPTLQRGKDLYPSMFFAKTGNPISLLEWEILSRDENYKRVRWTDIGTRHVSTVWLGGEMSPQSLFETMIFCDDEADELNHWLQRYGTEQQAIDGHAEIVRKLENGEPFELYD